MKYPSPFRAWCQKVLPAVYDDSLSYYEVLCKVMAKINEVIDALDIRDAEVDSLLNWFNNLDVAAEVTAQITAKLDQMAESGELDRIIGNYLTTYLDLRILYHFNTVADMLADSEIKHGYVVQTMGYHKFNDGGGATYAIRTADGTYTANGYDILNVGRDNLLAILISPDGNILKFGAKAEVAYDNAPHIQAAVNRGADVIIPPGNFGMDSVVTIPTGSGARRINGNGMGASGAVLYMGVNAYFNVIADSTFFNGLRFIGKNLTNNNGQRCIFAQGQNLLDTDLWVENCIFSYFEKAVRVNGRGCQVHNTMFVHCTECVSYNFVGQSGNNAMTHNILGGRGLAVTNCRVHSVPLNLTRDSGAITIEAGSTVFNMLITDNQMDTGVDSFVRCYGDCYGGLIANNIINLCQAQNIHFSGIVDGLRIIGNSFMNAQKLVNGNRASAIIRFDGSTTKNCAINNNYFYGADRYGVTYAAGAIGCSVDGNTWDDIASDNNASYTYVWWSGGFDKCSICNNVVSERYGDVVYFARSNSTADKASNCVCLANTFVDGLGFNTTWFPTDTNTVQTY